MRLAIVVGALGIGAASTAAAPRPGKVVRVERRARTTIGTPRFCVLASDGNGRCVGAAPAIGDRIDVIDDKQPLGALRVTSVASASDVCNQATVWQIQSSVESGDLSTIRGDAVGLLDLPLDRHVAHLVETDRTPAGRGGSDQIFAVDEDGDGTPDVEFVQFACDDSGNPTTNPTGQCSDVWASTPHGFERIRQDRIRNCL